MSSAHPLQPVHFTGRIEKVIMNSPRCIASIALAAVVSLAACDMKRDPAPAARTPAPSAGSPNAAPTTPAPDNTARNKGDAAPEARTPIDQSEAPGDIKITAEIRRAIMDAEGMSINAQNCKIITQKTGLVTLRGVVNSQAEKDSIEAIAKGVDGVVSVTNQLEVKAD